MQKLDATHRDIADYQNTLNSLDIQINDVERSNDRLLEQQKKLLRTKDAELLRGSDLAHTLKEKEQHNKDAEIQTDILKKDLEGIRYGNDALLDRNHELKEELDSLNQHADLLT